MPPVIDAVNLDNGSSPSYLISYDGGVDYNNNAVHINYPPTDVDEVLAAAPNLPNYEFTGWSYQANNYVAETKIVGLTFTSDITVTAQWRAVRISYNGGVDKKGNAVVISNDIEYAYKGLIAREPKLDNYAFEGWVYDSVKYNTGDTIPDIYRDITVTAKWRALMISYIGGVDKKGMEVVINYPTTEAFVGLAAAPTLTNYVFDGWKYGNDVHQQGYVFTGLTRDITVTAIWRNPIISYECGVDNDDNTITVSPTNDADGLAVGPVISGFDFDGWVYEAVTYQPGHVFSTLTSDIVVVASWTASCFNKGTKILSKIDGVEEYRNIETLYNGALVKTYLHGYRKIDRIGMGYMRNNPNVWYKCMYFLPSADLTVTGGHGFMVDALTEEEQEKQKGILGEEGIIDNMPLLLAGFNDKCVQLTNTDVYTYYHMTIENDGDDNRRYGIYANGVLTETPSKNQFMAHKYMDLPGQSM